MFWGKLHLQPQIRKLSFLIFKTTASAQEPSSGKDRFHDEPDTDCDIVASSIDRNSTSCTDQYDLLSPPRIWVVIPFCWVVIENISVESCSMVRLHVCSVFSKMPSYGYIRKNRCAKICTNVPNHKTIHPTAHTPAWMRGILCQRNFDKNFKHVICLRCNLTVTFYWRQF